MSEEEFKFQLRDCTGYSSREWQPKFTSERQASLFPSSVNKTFEPQQARSVTAAEYEAWVASGAMADHTYRSYSDWNVPWEGQSAIANDHTGSDMGKRNKHKGVSYSSPSTAANYVRCYETHPPLDLGNGLVIHGGNCHSPIVKDADVYIALDGGSYYHTQRHWPWHPQHCTELVYTIQDMQPPANAASFLQLIGYLVEELKAGKKVHVGCIGGHGRTGMVLVGVYATLNPGNKQAIQYVREHYCKKAVETTAQVKFLMETFGVDKAEATKSYTSTVNVGNYGSYSGSGGSVTTSKGRSGDWISPVESKKSVWGFNSLK